MNETEIRQIINTQRNYFSSGSTLPVSFRIEALKRLKACILKHEDEINEALKKDLGKSSFESYMCETGMVLSEIREEDIPKLSHYADKEANPLYPVPVLMDAKELERFYYQLMETVESDS